MHVKSILNIGPMCVITNISTRNKKKISILTFMIFKLALEDCN
jgi:hypothetical protein